MGRRSINTTKSGKFMNPTDQARKEARKKELKKNRKQRQMVRAAVLKGKDPNQLMVEMEKIDQMEYDVNNPPPLNEKVLKDKRKKLRETFQRILKLYEKEDREQWIELKKLEQEYEKKRNNMIVYFESVKHAEQVKLEEIPLPNLPGEVSNSTSQIPLPDDIPLPTGTMAPQPHSILKKRTPIAPEIKVMRSARIPAGVPPGPPPLLSDEDDEEEIVTAKEAESISNKSKKIRFIDDDMKEGKEENQSSLQANMMGAVGQDINEFLKEMEAVHKQKAEESVEEGDEENERHEESSGKSKPNQAQRSSSQMPPGPPPGAPPPHVYNRPPSLSAIRPMAIPPTIPPRLLPPGPPPGPPPGMPPRMSGPPIRLPPGPPPGLPPRMMRPRNMLSHGPLPPQSAMNPNVLSAPPSLISRPSNSQSAVVGKPDIDDKKSAGATIEAKPQLRNLSADVTKFMPTSLRVKREDKAIKKKEQVLTPLGLHEDVSTMLSQAKRSSSVKGPTRDDAYDQFMKEMEGLL